MSLFTKSTSDAREPENKWKLKYLNLLDEHDEIKNAYQMEQELLCKTIIRLSLAIKGLDQQLDPHLVQIRNQLKLGLKTEQLRAALNDFSNALLKFEDAQSEPQLNSSKLLFDFLNQHYPQLTDELNTIQIQYDNKQFNTSSELFAVLLKIVPSGTEGATPNSDFVDQHLIDTKLIAAELAQLIESIDTPTEFEHQAETLKKRLLARSPADHFKSILDDAIKFLQIVKQHQQSEQKEMALFLSSLTEQLSELSLKASGASEATQVAAKKRNLLDESVSAQMSDLQKSSADATALDTLKQIVTTRIVSITQEMQEHTKNEELQRQETEKQLRELTLKITHLDEESKELKNKLIIAHGKASRDSLTNLPNRLAYEESLSSEIARVKRYKSIFSMVIWDIDFFKKINDTFGHKAGDKTLVIIANLLSKHCRASDFVARLGGEEFVMLLPNTDEKSALLLANKIRIAIEKAGFNANGQKINITASCGISQFRENDDPESFFERTDQALYKAKANGRNQCVTSNAP